MNEDQIRSLPLSELYSLLAEATQDLLDAINNKADGLMIHKQKQNVELLQKVICEKKKDEN